jgi:cytochrome c556
MSPGKILLVAAAAALVSFSSGWVPGGDTAAQISTVDPAVQDEIILARQGLMEAVSELMNEGEVPENDAEAAAMQANAEAVALSLPALKFLFPAETNPQNQNYKSSYRTYALPAIWERFDRFSQYLEASVASAYALERSGDAAQFPALARRLLETCQACHAEFRAPFQPPFAAQ